jgi:hypothetical protein
MAGHDLAVSGFFEIENIERFSRTLNYVEGLLGVLRKDPSFEEDRDSAERGNVGTRCEEFQKFTARLGSFGGFRHLNALSPSATNSRIVRLSRG